MRKLLLYHHIYLVVYSPFILNCLCKIGGGGSLLTHVHECCLARHQLDGLFHGEGVHEADFSARVYVARLLCSTSTLLPSARDARSFSSSFSTKTYAVYAVELDRLG